MRDESATSFAALAVWITLTRGLGQSALSVVSIAMVGHWFVRKIDAAMAVYSVVISVGFMMAFPLVGTLVQAVGMAWRMADGWLGPAGDSWRRYRRRWSVADRKRAAFSPTAMRSGYGSHGGRNANAAHGRVWTEALLTRVFWIFAAGTALYGLVASGIGLFNESILAQRGFSAQTYSNAGRHGVDGAGRQLPRRMAGPGVPPRRLMAIALLVLTPEASSSCRTSSTQAHVIIWATAMGLGGRTGDGPVLQRLAASLRTHGIWDGSKERRRR